jgi:hypothetical protein
MVQTTLKVKLKTFDILSENDDNARDEPFLWTFYLKIDGSTININKLLHQDLSGATVYMQAPTPSHNDLHLSNNDMDVSDAPANIPAAIGECTMTLQTDDLLSAFNPGVSKYCLAVALVIALEHDDTSDTDIREIWTKVRSTLQKKLNDALQDVIREMLFEGKTLTEQQVTDKLKSIDRELFVNIAKKVIESTLAQNVILSPATAAMESTR